MRPPFRKSSVPAALLICLSAADGLVIRGYTASRHDRFTGFPSAPVPNASAWFLSGTYAGSNYSGVGWLVSDTRRQFALVSAQHFVMPTHWGVGAGDQIRFLSTTGQIVSATIASTTTILDASTSVPTDLTLGRFTAPIPPGSNVSPFPYASTSETSYVIPTRASFQVFGFDARVGSGTPSSISPFSNITLDGQGTTTRMYAFQYLIATGGTDNCYFIEGDSGSPSFVNSGSKPLLTGTHSAVGVDSTTSPTTYTNYDTFVPHYLGQLNVLMATDGYQMIPPSPASTTLASSSATSPATLRRLESGTATFTIRNSGSSTATNPSTTLTFPVGSEPSSVSGSGWFADVSGPQTWTFHRITLAAGGTAPLTATWTTLPDAASIPVTVQTQSDGSPLQSSSYTLAPAVSYGQWSNGLILPAPAADPDGDGRPNLIEYAFGSDPLSGAGMLTGGSDFAGPVMSVSGGTATLRFPVRSDSQIRGLTYLVEFSDDLATWTQTQPAGTATSYTAYSPAVSGFKQSSVTFPAAAARKFARVRIALDQTTAGMTVP